MPTARALPLMLCLAAGALPTGSQALREPVFDPLLDGALCANPAGGRPIMLAMLALYGPGAWSMDRWLLARRRS